MPQDRTKRAAKRIIARAATDASAMLEIVAQTRVQIARSRALLDAVTAPRDVGEVFEPPSSTIRDRKG
jgi:hypothetical protein